MMRHFSSGVARRKKSGFTLIELLIVIAIIAILTAILLPVFSSVRENARESSSLANMHQISTAIAQFRLDNHKAPDVLFGYAYTSPNGTTIPMSSAYDQAVTDDQAAADNNKIANEYFPGLYPEYVKDYRVFTDGNNADTDKAGDQSAATAKTDRAQVDVNVLCPNSDAACTGKTAGTLVTSTAYSFYLADAYDISPAITSANKIAKRTSNTPGVYVARYQSSWTDIDGAFDDDCTAAMPPATCVTNPDGTKYNAYTHQLRWKNPPAEAYVTSTTYHVPNAGRVLVLWEDGSARKMDTADFLNNVLPEAPTTVAVTGTSPDQISGANFWKLNPNGP